MDFLYSFRRAGALDREVEQAIRTLKKAMGWRPVFPFVCIGKHD